MLSVFLDTLLICSATALMLLCSGVEPTEAAQGAPYVQAALSAVFGSVGPIFITVAMVLFAFTTLIGNLYYVDNALAYLMKKVPSKQFMVVFRIVAVLLIFVGAGLSIDLVWNLADVLMGVMVMINIPVIFILARPALAALKDYTAQRKTGRNPVFKAASIDLKEKTVRIYGKGAKERILQIGNPAVLSALASYQNAFAPEISSAGCFFVNRLKKQLSDQSVRFMIRHYARLAGIEQHITPHMFRHSFATLLLEQDVDIRYIQRMLGHSSISTTEIYTYVSNIKQKDILFHRHPRNFMEVEEA